MTRTIQPLGEQIIIRTLPVGEIGSIIVPDTAQSTTLMSDGDPQKAVHFVEAEVIATGPGKRMKGDPKLLGELAYAFDQTTRENGRRIYSRLEIEALLLRAENGHHRVPLSVKPKEKILYHPAVQKFDRDITALMTDGSEPIGTRYYIIREESVLAVIEREDDELPALTTGWRPLKS